MECREWIPNARRDKNGFTSEIMIVCNVCDLFFGVFCCWFFCLCVCVHCHPVVWLMFNFKRERVSVQLREVRSIFSFSMRWSAMLPRCLWLVFAHWSVILMNLLLNFGANSKCFFYRHSSLNSTQQFFIVHIMNFELSRSVVWPIKMTNEKVQSALMYIWRTFGNSKIESTQKIKKIK